MIVFDLRCPAGHVFEAWFGSSAAFEDQRADGLVACPMCGSDAIEKAVMAPNVGAKGNQTVAKLDSEPPPAPAAIKAALAAMARAQAAALEHSQWVGTDFADTARAMHVGDAAERTVHGQASLAEAKALIEDGVPIVPLPFPVTPPDRRN